MRLTTAVIGWAGWFGLLGAAEAQNCPRVVGAGCAFDVPMFIGSHPSQDRASGPWIAGNGYVIESATLYPLPQNAASAIKASVQLDGQTNPAFFLNGVRSAQQTAERQLALSSRPLTSPLGDALPGPLQGWVTQPYAEALAALQALGSGPWKTALRVRASYVSSCSGTCAYTFRVRVRLVYVGLNDGLSPLGQEAIQRAATLPRQVVVYNRCDRKVLLRVAVYKTLPSGTGARFSSPLELDPGKSALVVTPTSQGQAAALAWTSGWQVAAQFPMGFDPRTVAGGASVQAVSVWNGSRQEEVIPWTSRLDEERVLLTLCPDR